MYCLIHRSVQGTLPSLYSSLLQDLPVTLEGSLTAASAVVEDGDGNHIRIPCCAATGLLIEGHAALQCGSCERLYAVAPVTSDGCDTACVCCGVQLGGPMHDGQLHVPGLL